MFYILFGRCYCQWCWHLDVVGRCYCHVAFLNLQLVLCFGWCYSQIVYGRWWCCCHLVGVCIGRCYCHLFLWLLVLPLWSSVVPKDEPLLLLLWQMLLPGWLMVLPCIWLADVIAMWLMLLPLLYFLFCWQMLLPGGWCFCHYYIVFCWQMLLPGGWWMPTMSVDGRYCSQGGRWISHWVNVLILNLRFYVRPHPIFEAFVLAYVSV